METVRQVAIGGLLRVVLFAVVGLADVGWAESSNGGEQAQDVQYEERETETAESESAQRKDSASGCQLAKRFDELLQRCNQRCPVASGGRSAQNWAGLSFFAYPGCLVSTLLDVCNFQGSGAWVGIVIFVIIFAVFTRQAIMGYRKGWRLSFALFLIVFFLAVTGYFVFTEPVTNKDIPRFLMLVLASVFFAGVLSFWTKYMLDLLAVVLLAVLLVGLVSLADTDNSLWQDWLGVVTGIAAVLTGIVGGVWLYWWRDVRPNRKKPQPTEGGKAPDTRSLE